MAEWRQQFGVLSAQMDKFNRENAADKKTLYETIREHHETHQHQQLQFQKKMEDMMALFQQHLAHADAPPPRGEDRALGVRNNEDRHHPPRAPYIRLDIPRFDGDDPYNWVFKIEEYFEYHQTPEDQRIRIVSFHLDGRASSWFQWLKHNTMLGTTSWAEFLRKVKFRFGSSHFDNPESELAKLTQRGTVGDFHFDNPESELAKLTQRGTVGDFQTEFETLINKTRGVSEALLISFYIGGLTSSIRRELQVNRPSSLEETFALARLYEGKLLDNQCEYFSSTRELPTKSVDSPLSVRQLTQAEMKTKRERGDCFNCDQQWTPSHRCSNGGLHVLAATEGNGLINVEEFNEDSEIEAAQEGVKGAMSSLHLLSGKGALHSLRLKGRKRKSKHEFDILIDNGSTHNFIKPELVERLKLEVQPFVEFHVSISNGDSLVCQQKCVGVQIELQGTSFLMDLFVLPIQGSDIILGIQWLAELGSVTHDYAKTRMEFKWKKRKIVRQGEDCGRDQM